MKRCPRCAGVKPNTAFARRGRKRQWLQSWCKKCQVARKRERWAADPAYRARHSARNSRIARDKRDSGNPRYLAQCLVWEGRCRAKRKGLPFEITVDDVLPLILNGRCPVFGTKFTTRNGVTLNSSTAPSLDQFVPRAGYTRKNTRVISRRANILKNDATVDELAAILRWMRNGLR